MYNLQSLKQKTLSLQKGCFIKSTSLLNDSVFQDVIIYITEHNNNGAIGFIINKRFERKLNELVEFNSSPDFPLYNGGPVDQEHLFFIHKRPDVIEDGILVSNGIYNGGNFAQAVEAINKGELTINDIKIFIGYCGWDSGELEAEIEEGSWLLNDENVFAL